MLDPARRQIRRADGELLPVTGRVYDVLLYLVGSGGELVTKRELMDAVWSDAVVEENNLSQTISTLRRLLGERPDEHRYIVTVPGRGYQFVASVNPCIDAPRQPPPALTPRKRYRITFALLALGVGAGVLWLTAQTLRFGTDAESVEVLAVLPFRPIVPEASDPALELGMADTLITRLSASGAVIVRPLSSVRRFAALDQDPIAAGRALNVDAVLEGSIQRSGDAVRITTRLVRVSDGASMWTEQLDEPWAGVFAIQDTIAERVAGALELTLTQAQQAQLRRRDTRSDEAYRLFLLGRYHWSRLTPPEIEKAVEYFEQAIAIDPGYARAHAGLAEAYRSLPITSDVRPGDVLPLGKAAAFEALELDPALDDALATVCFIEFWFDWDWTAAERSCRRALELNPNGADAHRAYALLLSDLARHDEAVAAAKRARELDPLSLLTNVVEGHVLLYAGRHRDAVRRLEATLELADDFWIAHLVLGKALLASGRRDEALERFQRARTHSHGNTEAVSLIGYTHAQSGDRATAQGILAALRERAETDYVPPFNIAMVYHGLGERDSTFEWLEKAYADRDVRLTFLKVERQWNSIRGDPRFVSLMRRMQLE